MKRWWLTQSARINALSLRERVFLFLSVIAGCMALADVVWLSPAQVAHKQVTQRFEKQSAELQRAREALKVSGKPLDTSKGASDELAALKIRLETVNREINDVLPVAAEAAPLAQVLGHLLRRHEGLTLVRTAAAAPETAAGRAAQAAGAVVGTSAAVPTGLTRQGVELTVSGPYTELMRYVQTLEKALPHVRWGAMKLASDKSPTELTLHLFLVGVQP